METFIRRVPHIAVQVFLQLDSESLKTCREVTKHWQKFIDDKNLSWTRIVELPIRKGKSTYLRLAFKTGKINVLKTILEETDNETLKKLLVRLACEYAHTRAAEWLIQNSLVLDIDLKNVLGKEIGNREKNCGFLRLFIL